MSLDRLPSLTRYSVASQRAAGQIIEAYSTSFGLSTRLLGRRHRSHVRNIYALVRVADELVDGVGQEAGLSSAQQHRALDLLARETASALALGYSSNPVVHAFARTARACGIDGSLTDPFFESMRADLQEGGSPRRPLGYSEIAHRRYVYGSAEVIGLMCLRVFTQDLDLNGDERLRLEHGARRLGSAFQNVNFLRDLADDTSRLGRSYLGERDRLEDADRDRWVETIREQLHDAAAALPLLPAEARVGVSAALGLFTALTDRIAATPAQDLYRRRVRLSGPKKTAVVLRSAASAKWRSRA